MTTPSNLKLALHLSDLGLQIFRVGAAMAINLLAVAVEMELGHGANAPLLHQVLRRSPCDDRQGANNKNEYPSPT